MRTDELIWSCGSRRYGVELMLVHDDVESFAAGQAPTLLLRLEVLRLCQRALRLRALKQLLPEERQIGGGGALVERDNLCERLHLGARRQLGKIGVDAG